MLTVSYGGPSMDVALQKIAGSATTLSDRQISAITIGKGKEYSLRVQDVIGYTLHYNSYEQAQQPGSPVYLSCSMLLLDDNVIHPLHCSLLLWKPRPVQLSIPSKRNER